MLLYNLQNIFNTPFKFFYGFISTPEGQASFQAAKKMYPQYLTNLQHYKQFNHYIIEALEKSVINYLSDDELHSGFFWLDNMNKKLSLIIYHYIFTYYVLENNVVK